MALEAIVVINLQWSCLDEIFARAVEYVYIYVCNWFSTCEVARVSVASTCFSKFRPRYTPVVLFFEIEKYLIELWKQIQKPNCIVELRWIILLVKKRIVQSDWTRCAGLSNWRLSIRSANILIYYLLRYYNLDHVCGDQCGYRFDRLYPHFFYCRVFSSLLSLLLFLLFLNEWTINDVVGWLYHFLFW